MSIMQDSAREPAAGSTTIGITAARAGHAGRHPRIAVIAPGEIFGGAERQILALMRNLRDRGIAIALCVFHDADLARLAREHEIATTVLGVRGLIDMGSLALLRRAVHEFRPEILHIHGYRAAVYGALAFRPGRFAFVKTEHGGVESGGARLRDRLKLLLYRRLENWAARYCRSHIVYVTEDLRTRCLREHAGIETSVIHNGIEPLSRDRTRRPPEYAGREHNISIVGRLEPVKGIEHAIRAMALPDMPRDVRLHIVGNGPLHASLLQLARDLGVDDRVSFPGFRRNVYDYIAHADALLMPSLHEGLPYTLLEAMSLGTPVLAARVGGLAEALVHERTALLFEPASEAAIAAAVARLHSDRALARSLATNAREECARRFSADAMAERYLELFHRVRAQVPH